MLRLFILINKHIMGKKYISKEHKGKYSITRSGEHKTPDV
jgi:predicted transcriptional regulator